MIYVGADVHVRNSILKAKDANGQVLAQGRCGNTLGELAAFFGPLEERASKEGGSIRVVMESTTNSWGIRRMLLCYGREAGIDLTADVLHARKLRIIAESVNKCDRVDTNVLTDLARSNLRLPVSYMPDDEEFALREHLRARRDLVQLRTMLKNRVHALLHRRAILTPTGGLFTQCGRGFLDQVQLDEAGRTILTRYRTIIEELDRTIRESRRSLERVMRLPRWAGPAALLQTMPGIGLITALTILAELGDLHRFRSRAAVANYAGLVPRQRASAQKHWSGGITRQGSTHLRAVLIEAAWIGVNRVPAYRGLFDRVQRKKDKRIAIVAVARRMLEDAWMLLIKDQAFRYVRRPAAETGGPTDSRVGPEAESSVAG